MKKLQYILIFFACALVACWLSVSFFSQETTYEIISENEISIFKDEQHQIDVKLTDQNGIEHEGKYKFKSSNTDLVNVDEKGIITINESSSIINYEDVYIYIQEENKNIMYKVKINIIFDLKDVFEFTSVDQSLSNPYTMIIGTTYMFEVSTLPRNFAVEDYFDLQTFDLQGNSKEIFKINFDNNVVSLTPEGIGQGIFKVNIVNKKYDLEYSKTVDFIVHYYDNSFTKDILNSTDQTLLTKNELKNISKLYITSNTFNINENFINTFDLTKIKSIVFLNKKVCEIEYIDDNTIKNNLKNIYFRVADNKFNDYLNSNNWQFLSSNIIPYDSVLLDYNDAYVVYHYSKQDESENVLDNNVVSYKKIDNDSLNTFATFEGYTNIGWKDINNNNVENLENVQEGIHLFAEWQANEYIINLKGGGLIEDSELKVQYNSKYSLPTLNTYNGWKFEGWYLDENFETKYECTEKYLELSNTVLYAKWTTSIILDYSENSIDDKTQEEINDVLYGSDITLISLNTTRNWDFAGWYTEKSGKGEKIESGKYIGEGNVCLYAKWTYDLKLSYYNEEFIITGLSDSITLTSGLSLKENACELPFNYQVDDNWMLESWHTQEYGKGKIISNDEVITISSFVNYNTGEKIVDTIYAFYTSNAYFMDGDSIKYQIKIHYNQIINPHSYEYVSKIEKEGYDYVIWDCVDNEGETLIISWIVLPNGEQEPDRTWTITCTKKYGNVMFSAQFKKITYNVIFDLNGGSLSDNSALNLEVEYDTFFNYPSDPVRRGYKFIGWKMVSINEEVKNKTLEKEELINLTSTKFSVVKFEAIWEANTYNFLLDGNTIVLNNQIEINYDQEMNLEDLGTIGIWTFDGWYIDREYTQEVNNICNYIYEEGENFITLYSKWITTLTFDYDLENTEALVINDVVYGKPIEINGLHETILGWNVNSWYSDKSGIGTQIELNNKNQINNYNYDFNVIYPKLECEATIKFDHLNIVKNGEWDETITIVKGLSINENILPDITCFENESFQSAWTICKWTSDKEGNNIIGSNILVNDLIYELYPHFESKIKLVSSLSDEIVEEINIVLGDKIKLFTKEIINKFDSDYRRAFYAWKYDENTITEVNFEAKKYNIVTKEMANRIYTALYKDGMYTVKYVYTKENGQIVTIQKKYSLVDEQFTTFEAVQKEGYTFIGWQYDGQSYEANLVYDTFARRIGEVIVMNAEWLENQYEIKYVVSDGLEEISGQVLKYSEEYQLSSIYQMKPGYIFIGWSKSEDRAEVDFKDGEIITKLSKNNNDVIYLYDCYQAISYYINLYDTEKNLLDRIEKLYTDEEYVLSTIEKSGYTFITWEDEEGNFLDINTKINKLTVLDAEINLYAHLQEHEYTINVYDENNLIKTQRLRYSEQIKVSDLVNGEFNRLGYYYDSIVDEEANEYLLKQNIYSLSDIHEKEVNLFIEWKPIEFTVDFEDYNDELTLRYQINFSQSFAEINNQIGLVKEEKIRKDNFQFVGWFFDSDYTIPVTNDTLVSDIVTIENIESICDNNYIIRLYAKYSSKLILNRANGLDNEIIEIIYGEEIKLPVYNKTNNWEFKGWYLNDNYYDFEKIGNYENNKITYIINDQSGNLELYARWTSDINLYTFKDRKIEALSKTKFIMTYGWTLEKIFEYNNTETNPLNFSLEKGWALSFLDDINNIQNKYSIEDVITKVSDLYVDYECQVMFKKETKSSEVTDLVIINLNWLSFDGELNLKKLNLYDLCLDSIEAETGYTPKEWIYVNNNNITKVVDISTSELSFENALANSTIQMSLQAKKYTIYFDPGTGGTLKGDSSLEVTYDEPYGVLPKADKFGYDNFNRLKYPKWLIDDKEIDETTIVKITDDQVAYPVYKTKKIKIQFNTAGGDLPIIFDDYAYYEFGDDYAFPVPYKTNYAFLYWTYNGISVSDLNGVGKLTYSESNITVIAKYTVVYTTIVYSVDNGKRDKRITDEDGVFEIVNPNFNVSELKSLGYNGITIKIDFDCQEENDGYQDLWICCFSNKIEHQEFEHSPNNKNTSWKTLTSNTFYISFNSISSISSTGTFYVEWGANGEKEDDWNLGKTTFTIGVYK